MINEEKTKFMETGPLKMKILHLRTTNLKNPNFKYFSATITENNDWNIEICNSINKE